MKLCLLYVAGGREPFLDLVDDLFSKKIKGFLDFQIVSIKVKGARVKGSHEKDLLQRRDEEAQKILAAIRSDDYVIVFDEKGKAPRHSQEFSHWLVKAFESGKKRVVAVLGGAYGVSPAVDGRAQVVVSLSTLTFSHQVARVVALEQLYRGLTIWKKVPYHHE